MSANPSFADVTLAVLAGGHGTRMGVPKARLQIKSRPVLEYLLDRWQWPGPTMLITAPGLEHPPGCERFSVEAVDAVVGQGPLRGIVTAIDGLRRTRTSIVLITTVDMPGIGSGELKWLTSQLQNADRAVLGMMPTRVVDDRIITEPFPCIARADAGPPLRARLEAGDRAVHSLVPDVFAAVPVPAEWAASVWINLNRPRDLDGVADLG